MQMKTCEARTLETAPGKREIIACISTTAVDRQNEVVLPTGMLRKNHAGMTVFYNHDTSRPIGVTLWIKPHDGKILAKFRCTDKTPFARDIFALAQDGVLRTYSIGFRPLESSPPTAAEIRQHPEWADAVRVHRSWELLEFSLVGVPANPEALMLAISKGISPPAREAMEAILPPPAPAHDFRWLTAIAHRLRPTPLEAAVDRAVHHRARPDPDQ
jgi:HK97 family phage prohead protease